MHVISLISLIISLSLPLSSSSSSSSPNQNETFGNSFSDLGIIEYDAQGNRVPSLSEPKPEKIGNPPIEMNKLLDYHVHLEQYKDRVKVELKKELKKYGKKLNPSFGLSEYLSKAACLHSIDSETFAKYLAGNIIYNRIRNLNQINDGALVNGRVRMRTLRGAGYKIKTFYENQSGAGPSNSGSQG